MKSFKIYENPFGLRKAVKIGWSWPGFMFAGFWLIAKKLWVIAGIFWFISLTWLLIDITVLDPYYIEMGMYDDYYYGYDMYRNSFDAAMNLGFSIGSGALFGTLGNKFIEDNLISRGFIYKTTVYSGSPEGAIASYFAENKN